VLDGDGEPSGWGGAPTDPGAKYPPAGWRRGNHPHRPGRPPPRKRLCQTKAKAASRHAPTATGARRKLQDMSLSTTTRGSIPAGGGKVLVRCIATIARPTASAAANTPGPVIFTPNSPTTVDTTCPPMSGRGCAASISGEPMTSTIEVANGTNMSGKAARSDNSSISAMATAPPAAPAMTAIRRCMAGPGSRKASTPPRDDLSVGFVHPKSNGRRTVRNRRPPIVLISAYLRLAIAVRSNLPVATKVALHQLEPNPPGLIPLKSPENRAVWSLVKALQSALL